MEPDRADLRRALNLGMTTYLTAYIHLMGLELGIDTSNREQMSAMASIMLEVVNFGTEISWRALMNDQEGTEIGLARFRELVEALYED